MDDLPFSHGADLQEAGLPPELDGVHRRRNSSLVGGAKLNDAPMNVYDLCLLDILVLCCVLSLYQGILFFCTFCVVCILCVCVTRVYACCVLFLYQNIILCSYFLYSLFYTPCSLMVVHCASLYLLPCAQLCSYLFI